MVDDCVMADLSERCVLLKNLPRSCTEHSVRELLDLAHGDFRFQDRYGKLHRHVEFEDDVRWIVLFHTKQGKTISVRSEIWNQGISESELDALHNYATSHIDVNYVHVLSEQNREHGIYMYLVCLNT